MYPVEYAAWLLNPLRRLIAPPGRIADRLQLASTDRVLEVGCRPGFFSPTIARRLTNGHITLLDAQPPMLELARQRLERIGLANFTTVCGLAEKLPFRDESFDVAFMAAVLGEVPDRVAAIKEAARVLCSGGRLSTTEAAGDPDRVQDDELDALAKLAGVDLGGRWPGLLIRTFNYRKPARLP
jgi:ubiquinone/menaquinone biosynthesis C-methylase UbiE